jgi:hypothetical protein
MTNRTDDWRTIFGDLTDSSGCYEMGKVNLYQLTSHLEELYLKIEELETQLKGVQEVVRTHEYVRNIGL